MTRRADNKATDDTWAHGKILDHFYACEGEGACHTECSWCGGCMECMVHVPTCPDEGTIKAPPEVACDVCIACWHCPAHDERCGFDEIGWQLSLQHLHDHGYPHLVVCARCRRPSLAPGASDELRERADNGTLDMRIFGWVRHTLTMRNGQIATLQLLNDEFLLDGPAVKTALADVGLTDIVDQLHQLALPWSSDELYVPLTSLLGPYSVLRTPAYRRWANQLAAAIESAGILIPNLCEALP